MVFKYETLIKFYRGTATDSRLWMRLLWMSPAFFLFFVLIVGTLSLFSKNFKYSMFCFGGICDYFEHFSSLDNEVYNEYFFLAGSYACGIFTLGFWNLQKFKPASIEFYNTWEKVNVRNYRDSVLKTKIQKEMKESLGMWTVFCPQWAFQMHLLSRGRKLLVNVDMFKRRALSPVYRMFSVRARLLLALEMEFFSSLMIVINTIFVVVIVKVALVALYISFDFLNLYLQTLLFAYFPFLVFSIIEVISVGMLLHMSVFRIHMKEVNRRFRENLTKTSIHPRSLSKFLINYHETASLMQSSNKDMSSITFLWFYWLIPSNAYLLYRLVFVDHVFYLVIGSLGFFLSSLFGIFGVMHLLSLLYVQFYRFRKVIPALIPKLRGRICLMLKYQGFYERLTCKNFRTGYRIPPDMVATRKTLFSFAGFYAGIVLHVFHFFLVSKSLI